MTRRRRRGLVVLALTLLAAGLLLRLPAFTRALIAARLSGFFQRPVTVGAVRFHLSPVEIEVLDLRVNGPAPGTPPFLEIPRLTVLPSVRTLVGPQVVLSRLKLQGLKLRIHSYPAQGDDIPRLGGGGGKVQVRVRRLVIQDGEFRLDHERVPLTLDLPDFEGRLAGQRGGVLAGHVSFGRGPLQFGSNPPFTLGTEIDLTVDGGLISVQQGHLRAQKTDVAYTGWVRLSHPAAGQFHLKGPVDLDLVERHVMRTGFGVRGDGFYDGGLQVEGSRLRLAGRFFGTNGEFDGVPVPRFDGHVSWDERGVILTGLATDTLGGAAVWDVTVPPQPGTARLKARLEGVDAERLLMAVFDLGSAGVGSAATGEVDLQWPRGRIRRLSGRILVDLEPRPDGRTPLGGRFEWHARDGVQFVDQAALRTPGTGLRLAGRIEVDDRADLQVDADSSDLAASDDLGRRLRVALGTADAQAAGFSGRGVFHGRWIGTLHVPVFEGRVAAREVDYLGVRWGDAEWVGQADPEEVRSHSLVLRRPGGELWLDGRTQTGEYGRGDALEVTARFRGWPAADFIQAFRWDLDARGLLSGEAVLAGRRSAPQGRARVSAAEGSYYGVPFSELALELRLRGDRTEIPKGRARVGGGGLSFSGSAGADGFYDGRATLEDVDVAPLLPPLKPDVLWGGRVSGTVTLLGPLDRPRLEGRLRSTRLFVGDEGLGALEATLRGTGDGRVSVEGRLRSPRVDLALRGSVGAAKPYAAELHVSARSTSVDPFLRVIAPRLPSLLGIVASGELSLSGPLGDPARLELALGVPELELSLPEYPVKNRGPLQLELRAGRLVLHDLHLAGEGTDLVLSGDAAVVQNGRLALQARGAADLRALSFVTPRLRGRGAARLALTVSGTRDAPELDGRLELDGAGLRLRGFPHGIEDLHGRVSLTEKAAQFTDVRGALGGGELLLSGQAAYGADGLRSFDVQASGRSLALRYPEGLRSVLDADLRLFGDAVTQWVTGDVEVKQALYSKRYELASELLAAPAAPAETALPLESGLRYDLKLRVPGTLRIDNNLAALQARADLTLQGSYGAPVVLGRAEIERGRVYFQGNTYVIRRGGLDFVNPRRTDPAFDIEAETRVRSYRVTLKVSGTLERVYPSLTSDPPLSAVQILNLLAGADESTVASLTLSQTDQAKLAAAGAATLAAGRLSEEVGLERGAERLFGLNRFSIDPSVVKGGVTNPTARLTVGKRLTPDLNVQYSVDLRGTEDRILSLEYTLSDRLSVLLTSTNPGGLGFDLRLRQSY